MKRYLKLVSMVVLIIPLLAGCFGGYNEYQHDKLTNITEADRFSTSRASEAFDFFGVYNLHVEYDTNENIATIMPVIDNYHSMLFEELDNENNGNGTATTAAVNHWDSFIDFGINIYLELQMLVEETGAENFGLIVEDERQQQDDPLFVIAEDEVQWQKYRQ